MIRRLLFALLGLLGFGLLLAAPASAHATVVTSSPADGARLQTAPKTVTITFDEHVGLGGVGFVHVTDQTGRRLDARAAYHPGGDDAKVADDLSGQPGDGTYTVSFRVVSADSHPVAGTIRFVVGDGALAHGTVGSSASDATTSSAFDAVRWVSYAGLSLLGGGWLLLTIWPSGRDDRRARRVVWAGWGLTVLGAVLEVVLDGPYAAGTGLGGIGATALDATLHTDYGILHSVRLLLLGVLALVLGRALQPRPIRAAAPLAGVIGLGVLVTFAASGHGASTNPTWVSIPLDTLHLAAMATWLGGLIMLTVALLPRREPDELRAVLPTFSTAAFTSVVVLAGTGTYAAWRGIGSLAAILGTTYGLLVAGKVLLFVALLALGNLSRQAVRRRTVAYAMTDTLVDEPVTTQPDVDHERLRRSVFVEVIIGLVVLVLSAVLVAQPRGPEALAADHRQPVTATGPLGGGRQITVTADPGTHGPVDLTVSVDQPLPAGTTITATATQSTRQIGPLPIKLTRRGDGSFDGMVTLPVAGTWRLDLVVATSDFDATTTDVELEMH